MTKKQLKNKLMKNFDGKYNTDIYLWEIDQFTEDFIREMKDYINFEELFDRRNMLHSKPTLSKDFFNEIKNDKNFGFYILREAGLPRYIRNGDISYLRTDLLDTFKNIILEYAKTLTDEYNDYVDFFERCYDEELKNYLKSFEN